MPHCRKCADHIVRSKGGRLARLDRPEIVLGKPARSGRKYGSTETCCFETKQLGFDVVESCIIPVGTTFGGNLQVKFTRDEYGRRFAELNGAER